MRFWIVVGSLLVFFYSCQPEGVINKTKYEGRKVINTCDQFKQEIKALEEANSGPNELRVSEYDNSDFAPDFLEPGQFVLKGDTLYFRLANDLEYEKYLHKGVAIHVVAKFQAPPHLTDLEEEPSGELPTLVIDRAYYEANKDPYFVYKIPVQHRVDGKQLTLSFSVVQYKKGKIKRVFCNSVEAPIGAIEPPCCTSKPWEAAALASVVQMPKLKVQPVKYKVKNITGTLDLIFPMNSVKFDRSKLHEAIFDYLRKYDAEGYKLKAVDMKGYASQGGTVEYNLDLSKRRAYVVQAETKKYLAELGKDTTKIPITAEGRGEDWERFELLVKTEAFTPEERQELLDIAHSPIHDDEKEAQLRKLPYWDKLVEEVLVYCRHTFIKYMMEYQGKELAYGSYAQLLPIFSPELYQVTLGKRSIGPYAPGVKVDENLSLLSNLINENPRNANLYALRSTYYFAKGDVNAALRDIQQAQQIEPNNPQYAIAALAYKTVLADNYSIEERMNLLNQYNDLIARDPNNKMLLYNKLILMDKIGYISGALAEYENLDVENDAVLLNNRGVALMRTFRLFEALQDFQKAVELNDKMPEPYYNMAVIYAFLGKVRKSAEMAKKAIEIDPMYKHRIFSSPAFSIVRDMPAFSDIK